MKADFDQVPQAAREVIELYETHAADLCFPNVDADTLSASQQEFLQSCVAVEAAQQALAQARAAQREQEEALVALARRAYAYACVYAEADPDLAHSLTRFKMAQPERPERAKSKPTGRKRRSSKEAPDSDKGDGTELPFDRERAPAAAALA